MFIPLLDVNFPPIHSNSLTRQHKDYDILTMLQPLEQRANPEGLKNIKGKPTRNKQGKVRSIS
jgi:hypothetical protein